MLGPFVHNIDPVIVSIDGLHLWWYGLSFTLGFLNAHLFLRRNRRRIGISIADTYDLTIFLAIGILIGGRALVVFNNEWDFYQHHLLLIPTITVGGFASHGLIFGGLLGVVIFCFWHKVKFREVLDLLAISASIILGFGRIGNFIDGQIFGSLTDMPWGVQFPVIDGFRHPVILYDGLKNFALVPILLWIRSLGVPPGRIATIFCILYAGLRIPIDMFREYPSDFWGLPNGQMLNIFMVLFGLFALAINIYRNRKTSETSDIATQKTETSNEPQRLWPRIAALTAICIIPLIIPSDATRDVPNTYRQRHPGLEHSAIYPAISDDLEAADKARKVRDKKSYEE